MRLFLALCIILWATITNYGQKATITIPNPSLPNYNPQFPVIPNPTSGSVTGYDWQEEQRKLRLDVDEQIKRTDPTMRRIYYGEPNVVEVTPRSRIKYSLPNKSAYGRTHFHSALKEIGDMVEKKQPYDLKRAVYLGEHAFDTTLTYPKFERQISKLVEIIMLEMKEDKISPGDNIGKIMTIFKFMADTITVQHPALEKRITTYPKTYDFEDFYGMQDYSKMFVSKLVRTGKGQCHSLPMLFLILCQELNAKAYLSFSPEHCYVKFQDKNGNLQNIELTNQMFTTDQFILQSGYVTAAAIKSRIYMDTLAMDKIILSTINDLTNNYVKKYGYDDFVLECVDKVLTRYPNSIHANMHVANYFNILGHRIENQYDSLRVPKQDYFKNDLEFRRIISTAIEYGKLIDNLGYAEMPPEMYSNWLNSLKNESMKQQHLERKRLLNTMLEH